MQHIAPMALQIQREEIVQGPQAEPQDNLRVVRVMSEPQWVRPQDITDFKTFSENLFVWTRALPSVDNDNCMALSAPAPAKCRFGILDDKCPVLELVSYLKKKGWIPVERGAVVHKDAVPGMFDATEASRQRRYLQVVTQIGKCIQLTSKIPSREVISYYDCLLHGIAAEPGQTHAVYALVLNRRRQKDGKMPVVLPLENGVVDPVPVPGADAIVGPVPPPKAPLKPKPPLGPKVHASRTEGGSSGSRDPAPPNPPVFREPDPICGPSGGVGEPDPICLGPGGAGGGGGDDDGITGGIATTRRRAKRSAQPGRTEAPGLTPGTIVSWQSYITPAGRPYPNYKITCTHHDDCGRTRGDLEQYKRQSGDIEPLAWLHCWECSEPPAGIKHSLSFPAKGDVPKYAEAHRAELEQLDGLLKA